MGRRCEIGKSILNTGSILQLRPVLENKLDSSGNKFAIVWPFIEIISRTNDLLYSL